MVERILGWRVPGEWSSRPGSADRPGTCAALGANGRRRVECEFGWEKVGKRCIGLIGRIV